MKSKLIHIVSLATTLVLVAIIPAEAESPSQDEGKYQEDGKYFDRDDVPTYNVSEEGSVDWYSYNGFRRYHAECHVCHGPDGLGSSFAPSLINSLKTLDYYEFMDVVVNGRENVGTSTQNIMPGFGMNPNVMCYVDDIYVYLRGRSEDAIARARPPKRDAKPDQAREDESACFGD